MSLLHSSSSSNGARPFGSFNPHFPAPFRSLPRGKTRLIDKLTRVVHFPEWSGVETEGETERVRTQLGPLRVHRFRLFGLMETDRLAGRTSASPQIVSEV